MRTRLAAALDSGMLGLPCSIAALRSALGIQTGGEELLTELGDLARQGISSPLVAELIRALSLGVSAHFSALVDRGLLRPLPAS